MGLPYSLPKSKLELTLWIMLYFILLVFGIFFFIAYFGDASQEIAWWLWALVGLAIFIGVTSGIYLIFNIMRHDVHNVILWIVLTLILCGIFFVIDYFDPSNVGEWTDHPLFSLFSGAEKTYHVITPFNWAPETSIVIASIVVFYLYIFTTRIIYRHAKPNRRNVVRWTTASIVFSPLLAGLIYLLTWPQKEVNEPP